MTSNNLDTMDLKQTHATGPRQRAPRLAIGAALLLFAAGCAVGPDYKRPAVAVPAAFKEDAEWRVAAPDDGSKRGPWWEAFNDPVLNELEFRVESSNLSIVQAVANYEEARQIARSDRTGYLPTVGILGSAQRSKVPASQAVPGRGLTSSSYAAELQGSWEPDFWGKLRRTVEADVATAQADAADLASARLSTQGTLAQDYIALRAADDQIRLLENAVEAYRRTVNITQNKYSVGVAARSDVITAQTQLDSTRAQLIGAGVQRAQYEHAIAVLLGKAPSDFSIERRPDLGLTVPQIPAQLPSSLLERRPDVAAAERDAAAANAKVGIQTAAYFPSVSISGAGGYEGSPLNQLITSPFKFWTLGAQAADTLLDWGQRGDLVRSARATFEATAANYRQTVLTAFQQVEDDLAELRILRAEAQVERDAVSEATQAAQIALNEYNAGTVDFTTVATAQVTELTNRETALGINAAQLTSSAALIQALGGGWTSADMPSPGQVVGRKQVTGLGN
ncbi:MAG: efflux transporter outer membrane subunit [Opitutaceae bacterium]|jgi:NodT family efflux transporter outer membrane factor (OMF) lipoprotein